MGKQLHEVMGWSGPMTHLQYIAWQAWLVDDLWLPDRHDLYLMQLTRELYAIPRRFWEGKYPDEVKLTDFRLRPKGEGDEANGKQCRSVTTDGWDGQDEGDPASSQEDPRPLLPGLPPVVTEANKAAIQAKIARAYRDYQGQLERQGKLVRPVPRSDPGQLQ